MAKNHMKRINAPKRWDVLRKTTKFISRPNPGRKLEMAISLNTSLKEMLGKTKTTKETKYLIRSQGAFVNGVRRWDEKFPVGFMDVLSLPTSNEHFRLIVNSQNKLEYVAISDAESKVKASKVSGKHHIAGGKIQVVCTDGRTFLVDAKEAEKFETNDTVLYTMPDQKVTDTIKLEKGVMAALYRGKHIGHVVKVEGFKGGNIVFHLEGELLETKKSYAFAVGKDKAVITVQPKKKTEASHTEAPAKKATKKKEE